MHRVTRGGLDTSGAVVLGVAQDGGHPQAGCRRPCCNPDRGRHLQACLGIVSGGRWIIDATPSLPEQLAAFDHAIPPEHGRGLDGILLTHAHMGHYTGLVWLGREGMGARGVPLYVRPRLANFLRANGPWSQLVSAGNVILREVDQVQLGAVTATAIEVPHRDEYSETVAWHLKGPRQSALYLPDIDSWEGWPLAEMVSRVDVAWLDGTFWADGELDRDMAEVPHPRVSDTLARLPPELLARVRFLHLNHTNPLLDPGSPQSAALRASGAAVAVEGEWVAL